MNIPYSACSVTLLRFSGEKLLACEPVRFEGGAPAIELVLRRAAISGRVELGETPHRHAADLRDANGDILDTVALDAGSYRALKTRWMRTRLDRSQR